MNQTILPASIIKFLKKGDEDISYYALVIVQDSHEFSVLQIQQSDKICDSHIPISQLDGKFVVMTNKRMIVYSSEIQEVVDTMDDVTFEKVLRQMNLEDTKLYYQHTHQKKKVSSEGRISYGGRFFDEKELVMAVDSSLDFWLTSGRFVAEFEKKFAAFLGVSYCSLVNSGSSANLLAFMALTSHKLGNRRIQKGDEVITVAAGFPTTVAPIIQFGAIPVFIDVTIPSYNIDVSALEAALSSKTKAVMIAHTLGNPFDLSAVLAFCKQHNLWLIEDNCDALGSKYQLNGTWQYTGTMGDIGTSSFYPPHHMTMGEGGAVYANQPQLKRIVESFRDWGRDCWCGAGVDNTCGKRFTQQFGELPHGYDHKYVYSHFGYNLKATEMQAAIGCAQLEKLPDFIKKRQHNWQRLSQGLAHLKEWLILPEATAHSDPSWFGFLMTVKTNSPKTRDQIVRYVEDSGIQTRMLFAGNLIKHPCFDELRQSQTGYRIAQPLINTDIIMNQTFWVGVYPGLTDAHIDRICKTIETAFN